MAVKELISLVLLTMVVNISADAKCSGGVECILLENCSGLYSRLTIQNPHPHLTKLLQSLHCGFDNNNPKICCPPEFESLFPALPSRNNFPSFSENIEPDSLLPDDRVCGIQSDDKMLAEHPWTVLLRYDKTYGWGFFCGGVLISSKYVLTTASCATGLDLPSKWTLSQVRLGEWNTSSSTDCYSECNDPHLDVPIEHIIVHESYDPTDGNQRNDIALLRLAQTVQFTDYIKPICLPMSNQTNSTFKDYLVEVAGWGEIESHSYSDVKLKASVPVIESSECSQIYGRDINSHQLCAGGSKKTDTCLGDYGGALMAHGQTVSWYAIGLASFRPVSCKSPEFPNVYTRVDAYVDWIVRKMKP